MIRGEIEQRGGVNVIWKDWSCRVSKCVKLGEVKGLCDERKHVEEESKRKRG